MDIGNAVNEESEHKCFCPVGGSGILQGMDTLVNAEDDVVVAVASFNYGFLVWVESVVRVVWMVGVVPGTKGEESISF